MKLKPIVENLLLERYVNLTNDNQKREYAEVVWDMLQNSYKKIGGYRGTQNVEELIKDSSLWKLVRKNNKIVAASIYKDLRGRKSIAAATDGTEEGKKALLSIWLEDLKLNRSWSEVSGATEHMKLKHGFKPISNKYAEEILGKQVLSLNDDGIHYTRMIGGVPYEKAIIGYIPGFENIKDFTYAKK